MLTEACIDFAARAIKELMPPNGPVKTYIPDDDPEVERLDKAERKKDYMNWQFLIQMPDFRSELEQLLTQLPLGGSQYLRLVWDAKNKRPCPIFVPIDDVYLPYAATNFYTAERVTYCEYITKFEFEQRRDSGMYEFEGEDIVSMPIDQTKSAQATDKIEGKDPSYAYNEDGLRAEFEVSTHCDLEEEAHGTAPYRITIDGAARKIVAINRNWEQEHDDVKETLFWMVEFPFVPWRGAYSIGLGQMMGSLAGGATGALRALLDSAHINNIPTLLRLKGSNFSGQSKELNVAEVTEIEGGIASDDIRKLLMPVPFNPPSPVLFQLLGFLVDAGRGLVQTTFEKLADQNPNMPVGTTLALIEEGMKVMSAIHLRMYASMNYVLRLLHRIDRMYLEDDEVKNDIGEVLAQRDDFQLPLDVVPVADPEIFSDVQRLAQLQVVADRAAQMPEIYNLRKVEERILERTKIPNAEELLMPLEEPQEMNAVNENASMSLQRPVSAFPQQDHLAHLQVHLDYLTSPMLGQLPIIAPAFMPMCLDHVKEHIALWYVNQNYDLLMEATGKSEEQIKQMLQFDDPETRSELDKTLAAASQKVIPLAGKVLAAIPQVIGQAMEAMQQFAPQQPQIPTDPNAMAAIEQKEGSDMRKDATTKEVAQLRIVGQQEERAAKTQDRALDVAADQQKRAEEVQQEKELKFMDLSWQERELAVEHAHDQASQAVEYAARLKELQLEEVAEDQRTAAELASRETINREDNKTALTIAAAEIESGEKVAVETGTGSNPAA